jgi:hypothetical protein
MVHGAEHFFGGGSGTDITALSLAVIALAAILLLLVPRRFVCVPFLVAVVIVPMDQQVTIASVSMTTARLLIPIALLRLAATQGSKEFRFSRMDLIMIAYVISNSVAFVILWGGTSSTIVNRCGFALNYLGAYWVLRLSLRSIEDIERCVKSVILVFALIGAGMIAEQATGKNVFSVFGGIPLESGKRENKIRAQGPFLHPLTAGTIGATLLPLAFGLWWGKRVGPARRANNRVFAFGGMAAALAMAGASRSSSAPLTLAAGMAALTLWPWRRSLNVFRWGACALLITLHMVMKAPVWALLSRIDLTGSSSGFHRFMLVDQFIRRFSEWWLIGIRGTEHWGSDMWDTINSFVAAGTGGGLMTLCCYMGIYVIGFRLAGPVWRRSDKINARWAWILGCTLFAHIISVFGISYFDQSQFVWLFNMAALAWISSVRPGGVGDTKPSEPPQRTSASKWFDYRETETGPEVACRA